MNARRQWRFQVVSYRNSTSNHNPIGEHNTAPSVVSYRNSTSNHNTLLMLETVCLLYLIEILHQTTTFHPTILRRLCCILSKFYIKPQPPIRLYYVDCVVSYRNSTSNHNLPSDYITSTVLYLIEILHQTTTSHPTILRRLCCILSKFYIKPQPPIRLYYVDCVVSYRNSTSNHNERACAGNIPELYLIEILHQTTTKHRDNINPGLLYLIEILHQTTTHLLSMWSPVSCILSKFYIKPQRLGPQ